MFWSGFSLSFLTASTRSPSRRDVFAHSGALRVVEATYFGKALIRSA
jgi:hypothetical protein